MSPSSSAVSVRAVAAIAGLAAVLLSGCRTVVEVEVVGEPDGSGEVQVTAELDAEAATALGGADRLVFDDLVEAGWELGEVETPEDGGLKLSGTRSFRDAEELRAVLDEVGTVAGGTPVFSDTDYRVGDGFGRTTYEMTTNVEVSGDPAQFSDEALTGVLGGHPLGWTPEELEAMGATAPGAGELVVTLEVPEGGTANTRVALTGGGPQEESLKAESAKTEPLVWALAALGAMLVVVAIVMGVRSRRS